MTRITKVQERPPDDLPFREPHESKCRASAHLAILGSGGRTIAWNWYLSSFIVGPSLEIVGPVWSLVVIE